MNKKMSQQPEEFLIECFCDETNEWVPVEISPNPWPRAGGEAEQLVAAGSRDRWTALNTAIARSTVSREWIKNHRS